MRKFLVFLFLLFPSFSFSTTYYVDATNGLDTNSGICSCSAWKTLAKVNSSSLLPDDSVLLKQGEKWREQLTEPSSGISGHPIRFSSYDIGTKPEINGANLAASWTSETGTVTNLTSDPNLQSYWYMESNGTDQPDGTANANTLTLQGSYPTRSLDHIQGTYSALFTASGSQALTRSDSILSSGFIGKSGSMNTAFTVGVWVKFNSLGPSQEIMDKGVGPFAFKLYLQSTGKINAQTTLDGTTRSATSDNIVQIGQWYHLVVRINDTTKKFELFVNGQAQAISYTATSTTIGTNTNSLRFGWVSGAQFLDGMLDEAFVFNRSLSDNEIAGVFNHGLDATRGPFSPYYYTTGFVQPGQVFENGTRMNLSLSKAGLTPGSWFWDSVNSRVYIYTTGGVDPATETIEVSQRPYGIYFTDKSYLTFDGISVVNANDIGIYGFANTINNTGIIIKNCKISNSKRSGIQTVGSTLPTFNDSWLIDSNEILLSGAWGIVGSNHLKNSLIRRNWSHHNCLLDDEGFSAGIQIYQSTSINNVMEYNESSFNGRLGNTGDRGYGFWLDTVGTGNIMRYNKSHDNRKGGFMVEASDGVLVHNNLSWANGLVNNGRGFWLSRNAHNNSFFSNTSYGNQIGFEVGGTYVGVTPANDMTGNLLKNNISIANTDQQLIARRGGENDGVMGSGNVYTFNAFGVESANFIQWGNGVFKSTYAAWETSYGSNTNSLQVDPLLVNPAAGDFRLQLGSLAFWAGVDVNLPPNIGAY